MINVIYIDNDIKLDDHSQPIKPFVTKSIEPASISIYKNYFREIQEIRINTDTNLLFTSYEETKTYKFSSFRENVDLRTKHSLFPGTFNQMTLITSQKTQIYTRTYKKLFDIIVQIGGFFNGIIYASSFILFMYSKNLILWECIYYSMSLDEINRILNDKEYKFPVINNEKRSSNNLKGSTPKVGSNLKNELNKEICNNQNNHNNELINFRVNNSNNNNNIIDNSNENLRISNNNIKNNLEL